MKLFSSLIRASSLLCAAVALAALPGCSLFPNEKDEEAKKNTVDCQYKGERLLVRFDRDEVRLFLPDIGRVYLYRVPSSRGVLYTNGDYELLGKGIDITFGQVGDTDKLECKPYEEEDKDQRKKDRTNLKEMD